MNKHLLSFALLALLFTLATPFEVQAQSGSNGSIRGNIFSDADGDAKVDDDEEDSSGQKVKLYRIDEKGKRIFVAEVVTDANGNYQFGGLEYGTYVVLFEFTSGVTVETAAVIKLTPQQSAFVQQPIPFLGDNYREIYGDLGSPPPLPGSPVGAGTLDALGLRNPANLTGQEVSRFEP